MKNIMKLTLLLFYVLVSVQVALAQGQSGKLTSLRRYAGTDSVVAVLNNPTVKTKLTRLLGNERRTLDHYTTVRSTINLVDDNLVIEGCAPHECDTKNGIVVIELYSGAVHTAIFESEFGSDSVSVRVYTNQRNYEHLPGRLREWIFLNSASCARNPLSMIRPPTGVVFR